MKLSFTFVFFLFSIQLSIGQNWSPPGAKWTYSYFNVAAEGNTEIIYSGDTLINLQTCKKLQKWHHIYNYIGHQYSNNLIGTEITYEQNGTVFIKDNNQFDTLYNFNASIGDSWLMAKSNQHPAGYYLTVIDTGSLIINATILKFIVLDFHNPPGQAPINYRDTAIEKIGFINTYMLPYDCISQWVDGNEGGPFRCYSDSAFSLYKPHYLESCDFVIGINETKNKSTPIQIGPNPTNEIIYLDNDTKGDKLSFSIYSIDGTKIKEGTVESKQINCSELPMGIYILTIKSGDESSQHFKFVKE